MYAIRSYYAETHSFFSTDLNWWGIPKPEKIRDFIETDFDLLLCIAREPNFYLEYILTLSKAKFKIGSSVNEENPFDLNRITSYNVCYTKLLRVG